MLGGRGVSRIQRAAKFTHLLLVIVRVEVVVSHGFSGNFSPLNRTHLGP